MRVELRRNTIKKIRTKAFHPIMPVKVDLHVLEKYLLMMLPELMAESKDPMINSNSPENYVKALLSGKLGDINDRYIIEIKEDRSVAVLIGIVKSDGIHITTLGTLPSKRKQGFGLSLLEYCREDMLDRGVEEIYLNVHTDNTPALKMYQQLGFEKKGLVS